MLGAIEVDALSSSPEDGHPLLALARDPQRCIAGQRWRWDDVEFAVLHPASGDYAFALRSKPCRASSASPVPSADCS